MLKCNSTALQHCLRIIVLIIQLFIVGDEYSNASAHSANAFLAAQYEDSQRKTTFKTHETVNIYIKLLEPLRKSSDLNVNWITPTGLLERTYSQVVQPTDRKDIIYFSSLKLVKNGKLARTFSGEDYDPSFLGQWQVFVYLDGEEICRLKFDMLDD